MNLDSKSKLHKTSGVVFRDTTIDRLYVILSPRLSQGCCGAIPLSPIISATEYTTIATVAPDDEYRPQIG